MSFGGQRLLERFQILKKHEPTILKRILSTQDDWGETFGIGILRADFSAVTDLDSILNIRPFSQHNAPYTGSSVKFQNSRLRVPPHASQIEKTSQPSWQAFYCVVQQ
jgi:hypothetical protein